MLWELLMVEQRYQAVREVLDAGATITDVARRYGVDRRTLHGWLSRYADGGLGSLADRSHRPGRSRCRCHLRSRLDCWRCAG